MAISKNTDWVHEYQAPFDQLMQTTPAGPEQDALKQQYLANLQQYQAAGGKQAAGAQQTYNQYYGSSTPATAAAAPTPAASGDPWAQISSAYGLGAPPAQGLPATMQSADFGAAPQSQAAQIDLSKIPQPTAQQTAVSPEILAMKSGEGYSPDVLAKMKANAIDTASTAGVQQMGQMKRILGQSGVRGGANAALQGDIARQSIQNQGTALNNIDINNAGVGNENKKFGIGQETQIGQGNMQAANAMALQNANTMFSGLQTNQAANQNNNQFNTGLTFQRQNDQTNMNYQNQKNQWDELNKRYGQSQNILGSWGAAA